MRGVWISDCLKRENTVDKPELSADSLGVYIYGKESPGYKAEFAMPEEEDDIVSIKAIQIGRASCRERVSRSV